MANISFLCNFIAAFSHFNASNCYFVVELVTLGWSQNETLLDKGGQGCFESVLWATRVVPIPEVVVGQGG